MTSISSNNPVKPPSFMVFCGDNNELFAEIRTILRKILPIDTYTIAHLSKRALLEHPWAQYCACLLIADTAGLDAIARERINEYLLRDTSKILIVDEQLQASLAAGKHAELFENVFGSETKLGKLFEGLELDKFIDEKEIDKTFAHDSPELGSFGIELIKRNDQPLFIHLHHPTDERNMIISSGPIKELFKSASNVQMPIHECLTKLGLETIIATEAGSQQPGLTPGFLFNQPDTAIMDMTGMTYGKELGTKPKLFFCPTANLSSAENGQKFAEGATPNFLPVEIRRVKDGVPTGYIRKFNVEKYYGQLAAKHFGRALLFVPVCTTTMDVSESISIAFPLLDGILVVAGHQTAGRGRIGNEWLCAEGAALFTMNLNVTYNSQLGQSICLLQHLMAVSICHAIAQLAPDFPIKIKWPNDLYFSRLNKIGGVLIKLSQNEAEQKYSCLIGVGINVANSKPTVCINDMLPQGARKLDVEEVLALVMSKFESSLSNFQMHGKAELMRDYYRFWLHTDQEVSILRTEDGQHERVVIRGLDDNGYLLVRSKETGQHISIHSDGNSFDQFQGLIIPKSM